MLLACLRKRMSGQALRHEGRRRRAAALGGRVPHGVREQAEGGPGVGLRLEEPPPLDRSGTDAVQCCFSSLLWPILCCVVI